MTETIEPPTKPVRREVGKDEFDLAYHGDPCRPETVRAATDNRRVIAAVLKRYSKLIPHDDLQLCGPMALWRCLQYHRPEFGQKLTTSLHRFAVWECRRELRRQAGPKTGKLTRAPLGDVPESARNRYAPHVEPEPECGDEDMDHLRECMEVLEDDQRRLIEMFYFEHKSIDEMCAVAGCARETVRSRLAKSVAVLKEVSDLSLGESH